MRERILILTENFPPVSKTSSFRPYAWAKYLPNNEFYPIIITVGTNEQSSVEKNDYFEVHRIPCKKNKINSFINKYSIKDYHILVKSFFLGIQKSLEYSSIYNPNYELYNYLRSFLNSNPSVCKIVVTARPFILFKFAYLLQKEFGIKWIADYRDDWSTTELYSNTNNPGDIFFRILTKIDALREKKWVKSADKISSVSSHYVQKICHLLDKPSSDCFVLENGYLDEDVLLASNLEMFDVFTITYVGATYPSQKLDLLINVIHQVIMKDKIPKFRILFVGTKFSKSNETLLKPLIAKNIIQVIDRVPKHKSLEIQNKSHLLLMISHKGLKGVPSSKLYEYVGMKKKVLVCPSDEDIIEKVLKSTGQGIFINDAVTGVSVLNTIVANKETYEYETSINEEAWNSYNRRLQTQILAEQLKCL